MSEKNNFTFTIFLPVKNGGRYLPLCVKSILSQTYKKFELVILAGYSSDGTCEWLKKLEANHKRIKVFFSDKELGIEGNWNRIHAIPKNEFMTIVGYDDILEPHFLEEINTLIQRQPDANLYLTHFKLIDDKGKLIRHCLPMPKHETASDFLAARMVEIRDSFGTGYVMRSRLYDDIGGIPIYPNLMFADDALWVKLLGTGFKATSPRVCFSYRFHEGSVSGTPNQTALFNGLQQYFIFLHKLATTNKDIDRVINIYGSQYIRKWCQSYYYHLIRVAPWGQQIDTNKLAAIEDLLQEFAGESVLHKANSRAGRLFIKYLLLLKNYFRQLSAVIQHKF